MSYEGPGPYRHYKGGLYTAIGLGEHEATGAKLVVYVSHDSDHAVARAARGLNFVLRPLDESDGPDAWNVPVASGEQRFVRLYGT